MRTDWQAYEAGALQGDERRRAEELLRSDPRARRELEGLKAFRRTVRTAALREPVPSKRLQQALQRVVARPKLPAWRVRLSVGMLAVCTLALAGIAVKNWPVAPTAQEQTREFTDFQQARDWAQIVSGVSIPPVGLRDRGSLFQAHAAVGWACFDYNVDNTFVHVRVSNSGNDPTCVPENQLVDGVFVGQTSTNAHFDYAGLTVSVKSPRRDLSVSLTKDVKANCGMPKGAGPPQVAR